MNRVRVIDCPDFPEFIGSTGYVYEIADGEKYPIKISFDKPVEVTVTDTYDIAEFKESEVCVLDV